MFFKVLWKVLFIHLCRPGKTSKAPLLIWYQSKRHDKIIGDTLFQFKEKKGK